MLVTVFGIVIFPFAFRYKNAFVPIEEYPDITISTNPNPKFCIFDVTIACVRSPEPDIVVLLLLLIKVTLFNKFVLLEVTVTVTPSLPPTVLLVPGLTPKSVNTD